MALTPHRRSLLVLAGCFLLVLTGACSRTGTGGSSTSSASSRSSRAPSSVKSRSAASVSSGKGLAPFFSLRSSQGSSGSAQSSLIAEWQSSAVQSPVGAVTQSSKGSVGTVGLPFVQSSSARSFVAQSSIAAAQATGGSVSLQMDADKSEAHPGDAVYYTITVRNTSNVTLNSFQVIYSFIPSQVSILETDGSTFADNVQWTVTNLGPQQKRALRIRGELNAALTFDTVVRTTALATLAGVLEPSSAAHEIKITQALPVTGPEDGTRPFENTAKFLSPFQSQGEAGITAVFWGAVILLGLGIGGLVAHRGF